MTARKIPGVAPGIFFFVWLVAGGGAAAGEAGVGVALRLAEELFAEGDWGAARVECWRVVEGAGREEAVRARVLAAICMLRLSDDAAGAVAGGDTAAAGAETGAGEGERSAFQIYREIERVIAERVRPVLQRDGGDIELVDIKGWRVYCSLRGRCASCLGASRTLQLIVERSLKDGVDERIQVIPV